MHNCAIHHHGDSSASSSPTKENHVHSLSSFASSPQSQRCIICRVPLDKPKPNTCPYTPKIVSIGPLHHGKPELQPMEKWKEKYQDDLLNRPSNGDYRDELLNKFRKETRENIQEVLECYKLSSDIKRIDYVDMLVVDGCFLIEFLLKNRPKDTNVMAMDDLGWRLPWIKHDILFFENQIPFQFLEKLYDIFLHFNGGEPRDTTILKIATDYLYLTELWDQKGTFSAYDGTKVRTNQIENPSNLLHLYHKILFEAKHRQPFCIYMLTHVRNWTKAFTFSLFRIVSFPIFLFHLLLFSNFMYPTKLTSAVELEEAGVRFQGSYMDLRFDQKQGTLFVPVLTLNEESLCLLKNLIAFEKYNQKLVRPYVHTYAAFLSDLINQPEDLKVMEEHHIIMATNKRDQLILPISNLLESGFHNHEALVNKEGEIKDFSWQHPRDRRVALRKYCKEPRHRWRAKLMKDYFGNPWSTFAFFIGVFLLILTVLQTVFKLLSYYKPHVGD